VLRTDSAFVLVLSGIRLKDVFSFEMSSTGNLTYLCREQCFGCDLGLSGHITICVKVLIVSLDGIV